MQRYWFALLAAAVIGGVVAGVSRFCISASREMETVITQAEQALEQQEEEQAAQLLRRGEEIWKRRAPMLEAALDHSSVSLVEVPLGEAQVYLRCERRADCAVCCRTLLKALEDLRDGQQFSFYNLF